MKKTVKILFAFGILAVLFGGSAALLYTPQAVAADGSGDPGGQPCGGFAGLECPNPNQVCVDDPRDNCDPKRGGADCIGVCRGPGAAK